MGSVCCTSDESNPTPAYVVEGGEAVLQCEFENSSLIWQVYNDGSVGVVANNQDMTDSYKYSTSKNPSTGLYYILHIKNVGVSAVMKHRCDEVVNGVIPITQANTVIHLNTMSLKYGVFQSACRFPIYFFQLKQNHLYNNIVHDKTCRNEEIQLN